MCGPAVPVLVPDLYIVNLPSLRFGIYVRFNIYILLACCLRIKQDQTPKQELFWLRVSQSICGLAVLYPDLYIVNCLSLGFGLYAGFDIYTVSMLPKDQAGPNPIARAIFAQSQPEHVWSCCVSAGT